jgi:L-iditol 2-dehydrogenase
VLGHESAGIVQECGSAVTTLKPGDRVAMEPGAACQKCHFCRAGKYNLCDQMQFAATPPYDGTLATFYALPEDFCFKLPTHISYREGALVEPLSVAVHCAKLACIAPGSSIIVFGAGPIGLLCCAVARAFGAMTIVATDILSARLTFAKQYAATHTVLMKPGSPAEQATAIRAEAGLRNGADIVIDATGVESCIQCGINALARGGTFVQAGLGKSQMNFPVGEICSKEAVYKGSFRYGPGDYDLAIKLLDTGKVGVNDLITHEYDFSEAEQAFDNFGKQLGIKSIIYGPEVSTAQKEQPGKVKESL